MQPTQNLTLFATVQNKNNSKWQNVWKYDSCYLKFVSAALGDYMESVSDKVVEKMLKNADPQNARHKNTGSPF